MPSLTHDGPDGAATDVIVVGAGPTGLTLACGLSAAGTRVRVLDRADAPATTSRANILHARGAEVLARLDALGDLRERAVAPWGLKMHVRGKHLTTMTFAPDERESVQALYVSQAAVEQRLRDRLGGLGVEVEWGRGVEELEQDSHGVTARTSDGAAVRASWLVGCDGAHSRVRTLAGIAFPGVPVVERFLLADVHADGIADREQSAGLGWYHRDGILMAMPMPDPAGNLWRLMANVDDDGRHLSGDEVVRAFSELFGVQAEITGARIHDTVWTSVFRINRRLADDYRRGRVLLAGDAAHIHSPFGGQGMNTGIGDAENLAWKLALVVGGAAGVDLLDTYTAERRPVAAEVLRRTTTNTRALVAEGRPARLLRDHVLVRILNLSWVQRQATRAASQLGLSYRRGPLGGRGRAPRPGDRVPDRAVRLPGGTPSTLTRELGPRWVLLTGPTDTHAPLTAAVRDALPGQVRTVTDPGHDGGGVGDALLVRPDGHLLWRGTDPDRLTRRLAVVRPNRTGTDLPGPPPTERRTAPATAPPSTTAGRAQPRTTPGPVVPLASTDPDLAVLGGKGASLARLVAAGIPVPRGVVVTTAAYDEAVAGLRAQIRAAVDTVDPDRPQTADAAGDRIRKLFDTVPPATAEAIRAACADLGPVAVRSSATAEDLPEASFAGQQDTFLDVREPDAVVDAVLRCWASLWTARAIGYRQRHGIAPDQVSLAVVVQEMVDADAAGVAFTRDPVTGADTVVVDAAWGLGEAVVSGAVTPDRTVVDPDGVVIDRTVADKAVRTVRHGNGGTGEEPVPAALRRTPVLSDVETVELARLARRIDYSHGGPVDVEWARAGGALWILQARPITTSAAVEVWNDSLTADRLWTSANLGEAIPSVMTPCTWSLVQIFMAETMSVEAIGDLRLAGTIGGRFYLDLSLATAGAQALGLGRLMRATSEQAFGRIPDDVVVPRLPLSRWQIISGTVGSAVPFLRRIRRYQRRLPELLRDTPARCDTDRDRIAAAPDATALRALWDGELDPLLRDTSRMLAAAVRTGGAALLRIRPRLRRLVGETDTEALLTGLGGESGSLASMGPVIGLGRLARGEIDRDTFARDWGHRCPDEFEVSLPRPAEDPAWIDRLLTGATGADPEEMLHRQERTRAQAWARLHARHPRRARQLERTVATAARGFRAREAARSEVIRAFAVLRAFVLRAGELTGHGDDLFQLSITEIHAVLSGDTGPLSTVDLRRRTYQAYAALPPYPTLIRGAFDPPRWAADPDRRTDVFDATRPVAPAADTVTGFPGAAGLVVGTARVLRSMAEAERLEHGDVLVTTVTNVGWTPLFPRAGAVVTDVGAPLSHAAIVARELGVPAVVGCGNATTRLRDGDTVRVDGSAGTVEVLAAGEPREDAPFIERDDVVAGGE